MLHCLPVPGSGYCSCPKGEQPISSVSPLPDHPQLCYTGSACQASNLTSFRKVDKKKGGVQRMHATVNTGKKAVAIVLTTVAVLCLIAGGAIPAAAQGQSGTSISATVTAAGYFTRTNTYTWSLSQSVSPSSAQLAM